MPYEAMRTTTSYPPNKAFDLLTASDITIVDAGGYYTSGNVEGALQEIGAGTIGSIVWQRTGTTLSPKTSGDDVIADGGLTIGDGSSDSITQVFDGTTTDGTFTYDGVNETLTWDRNIIMPQDGTASPTGASSHFIRLDGEGYHVPAGPAYSNSTWIKNLQNVGGTELGTFAVQFEEEDVYGIAAGFLITESTFNVTPPYAGGLDFSYGSSLAPTGDGTSISFLGGAAYYNGGDVSLLGGTSYGNNGDGGSVYITGGQPHGTGDHGQIYVGIGTEDANYSFNFNGFYNNGSLTWNDAANRFDFDSYIGLLESFYIIRVSEPTACTAALAGVAGNIDNGDHKYQIAYGTADGHTGITNWSNTVTVVDKTVDGQIDLTNIPVSTDGRVTKRLLFRTKAGSGYPYYLATINDNTTTTYTDNTADGSLGFRATSYDNTTLRVRDEDEKTIMMFGETNYSFGTDALDGDLTKGFNVAFGYQALTAATDAYANSAFGHQSLKNVTTGEGNIGFGPIAGYGITTGDRNVLIGDTVGPWSNNVNNCIHIGYNAGWSNADDDRLYIDISNTTTPLIYGEFDNRVLNFDGDVGLTAGYGITQTDHVDFNVSATPSHVEGRVHWDDDDKTLEVCMAGGNVNLQVGQELLIRAKAIGSNIDNGELVYISGGTGSQPQVSLAQADAEATACGTIAMATEDVTQNQFGYFTTIGLVREVDTSAYSAGDILYLSASTPGAFTDTKPDNPDYRVQVGVVIRSHANEGVIFVRVDCKTVHANNIQKNVVRIDSGDSPYTITDSSIELFCDTDGGAITVNLKAGETADNVRVINCGSSGNDITLTPNGAELLIGSNSSDTISDTEALIVTYEATEGWF